MSRGVTSSMNLINIFKTFFKEFFDSRKSRFCLGVTPFDPFEMPIHKKVKLLSYIFFFSRQFKSFNAKESSPLMFFLSHDSKMASFILVKPQ